VRWTTVGLDLAAAAAAAARLAAVNAVGGCSADDLPLTHSLLKHNVNYTESAIGLV